VRRELFVELEEVSHAGAVAGERVLAVATVHGAVEFGVGFGGRGRHGYDYDGLEVVVDAGGESLMGGAE
jgi:hypothetical protein